MGNLNTSIPCDSVINIPRYNRYMSLINLKKRLKIPKRKSESVYRRRTDTTGKRKSYKRSNSDLQNIHIKLKIE